MRLNAKFHACVATFGSTLLAGVFLIFGTLPADSMAAENRRNVVIATTAESNAAMAGESRIALVIGNASYPSSPLPNPVNDARAIAGLLKELGFRVTLLQNGTLKEMSDAARAFGDALRQGGVGLFYYAGHGVQIKGRNFLIPVGADIQREDEVTYNAFDAGRLLEKMEAARSRVNIVILDACRNNPFSRSFRSASQGLAQMEAPVGSYLAFATAPAMVASDGNGSNGLYTQHLLDAMRVPGLKIEEVFKKVRVKVMADSEGKQVPWDNSSLTGDFYFVPPIAAAPQSLLSALPQGAPTDTAPPAADDKPVRAVAEVAPPVVDKPAIRNKVLLAGIPPKSASPAARPPIPKVDPATSAANVALYKKGMEAKNKGDLAAAGEAFSLAADAGHPGAGYEMGLLLKIGRKPITQDLARAHQYFLKSAEQKNMMSQYELAQMFAQGVGAAKNCSQAAKWALKSAQAGSADAAVLLGELYRVDCDGPKNPKEAARWLRVAADQGVANAQFSLGVLYMNGDGVPKDPNEARKWLNAAAGKGNTSARFYLERIGK